MPYSNRTKLPIESLTLQSQQEAKKREVDRMDADINISKTPPPTSLRQQGNTTPPPQSTFQSIPPAQKISDTGTRTI